MAAGSRDPRRWAAISAMAMAATAVTDRVSEQVDAPVGSVAIGPLLAAIVCSPLTVAGFGLAAVTTRVVIDATNSDLSTRAATFHALFATVLCAVAWIAAVARHHRERELAVTRPSHRLTDLAAALAASRSVDDVQQAFVRMARTETGASRVRFVLAADDAGTESDSAPSVTRALSEGGGELGRVEIWYEADPDDETNSLLDQALPQVSVALARAQAAQTLSVTARRLAALQRSTSQLTGLLRTDEIARAMVVEARHALQADRAVFCVVDGGALRVLAVDPAEGMADASLSTDVPPVGARAFASGELVVEDGSIGEGGGPALLPAGDVAAAIAAPVLGFSGMIGVLELGFLRPHRFDDEERRIVTALVALVGAAWRRAARFEAEERESEEAARRAERAARLATLTATLADARDRAAVASAIAEHGLRAAEATWGGLLEIDERKGVARVVASRPSSSLWAPGATVALDDDKPTAQAVRERRTVSVSGRSDLEARYPDESISADQHARAAVPLVTYGRVVGVIGLAWDQPRAFDDAELEFLRTIGARTAEALERARLHEAEREGERRWSLLADASAALATALQPKTVVATFLEWSVPLVADLCAVYLVDADGFARPFLAVATPDAQQLRDVLGKERIDLTGDHPIARVFRAERAMLVEDLPPEVVSRAVGGDPRRAAIASGLQLRNLIVAPLDARGQRLGVLALGVGHSGRSFTANDTELVSDLASRLAIVYDNAVLYATEQNLGARLQSALLPASLVPPPGLQLAVRYIASGSRAGGDWYDLIRFGNSSAGLVVGDLVGHGIEAAATMSRYRSALRAYARMFDDPAAVMNTYSDFIMRDETDQTATVLYCRLDLVSGTLRYCSAGHPPPMLFDGSRCRALPSPQGPLIGLLSGGYTTETATVPPGSLLVLYTDGLLERRTESLDAGAQRLAVAIESLPNGDLEQFADQLIDTMHDEQHDDDIALIVARRGE